MKISQLYQQKKVVFSFEIFPPKKTAPIQSVFEAIDKFQAMGPDYISVTYGAGGTEADNRTRELACYITDTYGIPALAHLTCIHTNRQQMERVIDDLGAHGVENILALRGDRIAGLEIPGDLTHANELMDLIRERGDFAIGGACYPEGHSESPSLEEDILQLRKKAEAGASFLNTQLFFDNEDFFRFLDRCEKAGIHLPVSAGIMPITTKNQVERMIVLSGAKIPGSLSRMISKYGEDPAALRQAGINYAVGQIQELIAGGARGIHLYTMNRPETTRLITQAVRPLVDAANA